MTTPTTKKVSRVTVGEYTGRIIGTKPRKIVVTIAGYTIILRKQRCKQSEYLNIKDIYEMAAWARIRSERMTKINFSKRGRRAKK